MRGLIDALYTYAQENRIPDYLQAREYRRAVYGLEESLEAFRSTLTAQQVRELDTLLSRERTVEYLTGEAGFLAGISIGLDLGRCLSGPL